MLTEQEKRLVTYLIHVDIAACKSSLRGLSLRQRPQYAGGI